MMRALLCLTFVGCGRIAFDPTSGDARLGGDTSTGDSTPIDYRTAVMQDSPLGYWRLGDTGTLAIDETGTFNGLISGGCGVVAGLLVQDPSPAFAFNGSDCKIDLGPGFELLGPFTLEAWVIQLGNNATGNYQHIIGREERDINGPVDGYSLVFSEDVPGMFVERIVATADVDPPNVDTMATNVHLAATYDGAELRLYVDGVSGTPMADARTMATYTANAWIGYTLHPNDVNINYFNGVIDEVAIYDHALAAERVALHYAIGSQGPK